jgi:hypothetical protein
MSVEQMKQRFHKLKTQREAGEVDDEQFTAEVEKLQFRDKQGQLWRIGASTGHWYHEEEGRWIRGEPPREPKGRFKATVVALFLAIGVFVIVLITAGILPGREWILGLVTPATVVPATEIAASPPTATPTQMPTDTPSPTATFTQEPTVEPTEEPTSEPTKEPTEEPTVELTEEPTPKPTEEPTQEPTVEPTEEPMAELTEEPTEEPTVEPTEKPTSEPTEEPTPKPTNTPTPAVSGKIAFPVFDPERGTYDIFIANADGTGRKKIKEEASQPCLSPDGTQIAYRSWRSDERGLILADTSSGEDIQPITTSHEASRSSVSMRGIAYHRRQTLDSPSHIYLFPGSGEPKVIRWGDQLQPLPGESPAWVSGERLVFKSYVEGIGLYLTEGVHERTGITRITDHISDINPEASPDGKRVAFMSQRDLNWEIYVVELDSYEVTRLTEDVAADDGLPIWSPDGQTIAFASNRDGEWAMWAMDPDGSNPRMLFPLGGSLHGYVSGAPQSSGWVEERLSWIP